VAGLLLFLLLLVSFRHLALIGVTFVILSRGLHNLGQRVGQLIGQSERQGAILVLLVSLLLLSLLLWLSVHVGGRFFAHFLTLHTGQPLAAVFSEMYEDILRRLPAWVPVDGIKERVPHLVQPAFDYVRATGRVLLHLLIGLILAVIYVLDRAPVDRLIGNLDPSSVGGALRRYFGFLAEAIVITITLQVIVALVNTALTVPVLVVLRLPHVPAFTGVIFFSSLVPVVGNLVSGGVLIVASYLYQGLWAVGFFILTTFLLHKIEAYYLNPRLAARHVNLPALVIIVSLILHEHLFGLVGLFLSFPVLYVGMNVIADLRAVASQGGAAAASPTPTAPTVAAELPARSEPPPVKRVPAQSNPKRRR
jgi:predicted PurR-regulated permease PerM